jgi:hypothetical protein
MNATFLTWATALDNRHSTAVPRARVTNKLAIKMQ